MAKFHIKMATNYISVNIKRIRKKWGLSQTEMGELTGATRGMIMQYENRGAKVNETVLTNISNLTRISKQDLIIKELKDTDIPDLAENTKTALEMYRNGALDNLLEYVNTGLALAGSIRGVDPKDVASSFQSNREDDFNDRKRMIITNLKENLSAEILNHSKTASPEEWKYAAELIGTLTAENFELNMELTELKTALKIVFPDYEEKIRPFNIFKSTKSI